MTAMQNHRLYRLHHPLMTAVGCARRAGRRADRRYQNHLSWGVAGSGRAMVPPGERLENAINLRYNG